MSGRPWIPKIPETITALGSLATAAGGLAKLAPENGGSASSFKLYEIILDQGQPQTQTSEDRMKEALVTAKYRYQTNFKLTSTDFPPRHDIRRA